MVVAETTAGVFHAFDKLVMENSSFRNVLVTTGKEPSLYDVP
tara:strand:- start:390 stop:515 length:126 start_codon:yes stop_codon:yes gene_type:complete